MANRWWNNGNSDRLYYLGLQNHCSHEIKRRLFLGRNVMTNLDSILKSRHYPADKGPSSQSHGFSSMYGCESWTIKKAECQRIDAFELWCWRRLLRVPWTARRSNQSILKEISLNIHWKDWCWNWSFNTLATWCEELTLQKRPDAGRRAGGEGDDWGWDGWMASLIWWTWVWASSGSLWWTGKPGVLQSMRLQSQTRLSGWTELMERKEGKQGKRKWGISQKGNPVMCLTPCFPLKRWGTPYFI